MSESVQSKDEKFHADKEEDDGADDDWSHILAEPKGHLHVLRPLAQVLAAGAQNRRLG